jgi:lysyl-tRNA synthetase class 2
MSGPLVHSEAEPVDGSMEGVRERLAAAYDRHIRGRPVEASSYATVAYFVTLVVVRAFTTATSGDTRDFLVVAGLHIHHLVFGVVAILIAGVLALDEVRRLTRAVLFGIGAALVLDEFALLVFLKDVYWLPQGALSGFALVIGLLALAVNAWRGRPFLGDLVAHIRGRP